MAAGNTRAHSQDPLNRASGSRAHLTEVHQRYNDEDENGDKDDDQTAEDMKTTTRSTAAQWGSTADWEEGGEYADAKEGDEDVSYVLKSVRKARGAWTGRGKRSSSSRRHGDNC